MKTKNILRIFFAVIFVLGTMAMNAQTKFFIYKVNGLIDEYNIADVDSISLTAPNILTISVTGVSLDQSTASLDAGNTLQLTATIAPGDATNQAVTWSSDDETVATVDATGLVTAVDAGTATITVTTDDGGYTADCTVTVSAAATTLGPNLLVNPSFEDPDDGTATPVGGWTILEKEWLNTYYVGNTNNIGANNGRYGPEMDNGFFNGGNGAFFTDHIDGKYVFRTTASNAGGFYQVVSGLTPGDVYFISIDVGLRRSGANQIIREDESLKIVRNEIGAKDDVLIYEVPIPVTLTGKDTSSTEEFVFSEKNGDSISGTFTVPAGVTEVRFLLDKRNQMPGETQSNGTLFQSGLYMWDNCKFQKVLP